MCLVEILFLQPAYLKPFVQASEWKWWFLQFSRLATTRESSGFGRWKGSLEAGQGALKTGYATLTRAEAPSCLGRLSDWIGRQYHVENPYAIP